METMWYTLPMILYQFFDPGHINIDSQQELKPELWFNCDQEKMAEGKQLTKICAEKAQNNKEELTCLLILKKSELANGLFWRP